MEEEWKRTVHVSGWQKRVARHVPPKDKKGLNNTKDWMMVREGGMSICLESDGIIIG